LIGGSVVLRFVEGRSTGPAFCILVQETESTLRFRLDRWLSASIEKGAIEMKKGAIVCISGNVPRTWAKKDEAEFRNQLHQFEAIHFITPRTPSFHLNSIWLTMISRGITDLVLASARFGGTGKLELSEERFRFQAVGLN